MRRNFLLVIFIAVLTITIGCNRKATNRAEASSEANASTTSPWNFALTIAPDHPRMVKPTTFTVHVTDASGKPADNLNLAGSLAMVAMNMGDTHVTFQGKGNGNYEASVKELDMSGPWTLTLDASQGTLHAQKSFDFVVGE